MELNRRRLLALGAVGSTMLGRTMAATAPKPSRKAGRIMAIGGAEDRGDDRLILRRFVELSGGPTARIVVLTAATSDPAASWDFYQRSFAEIGITHCEQVDARTSDEADDEATAARLLQADGIFMTGGDQRRLMAVVAGTEFEYAMRAAFVVRGACIAGTSAGAAVLSRRMLAEGSTPRLPEKDAARLDEGLGFVPNAIIDQHFSERGRLGRLLSVVAESSDCLGVGIDEDTALVIERGRGIEVVGQGAVTLLDGRRMKSNHGTAVARDRLELLGVRLHLLPAGNRYGVIEGQPAERPIPASLREAVGLLVALPAAQV